MSSRTLLSDHVIYEGVRRNIIEAFLNFCMSNICRSEKNLSVKWCCNGERLYLHCHLKEMCGISEESRLNNTNIIDSISLDKRNVEAPVSSCRICCNLQNTMYGHRSFNCISMYSGIFCPPRTTRTNTSGHAVQGVGLRSLACWNCGFESHKIHRYLFLVNVVCCEV
jgi:hypothetical protein